MSPEFSVSVIGMAWYRCEHYAAIKSIMVDSDELPDTYEKWFYQAERPKGH